MKVIILAAGLGRRMQPLTDGCHKTLLTVGGQTVLGRILDSLLARGLRGWTLVTGYRAADVRSFVETTYPDIPVTFIHNERYESTNNIYSLALAFEQLEPDDDILLIESDLVFAPEILDRLLDSVHPNVALVDRWQPGMDGTVVQIDSRQVITRVIPIQQQDDQFDFSDKYKTLNIYKFSQDFYKNQLRPHIRWYAQMVDDNCFYELILGVIIYLHKAQVHAAVIQDELWAEIDDPVDLDVATFEFDPAGRQQMLDSTHGGYWKYPVHDFCYLRNLRFPPASLLSDLRANLPRLVQEYGSAQRILDQRLGYLLHAPASEVVLLNGASQAFPWLRTRFAGKRLLRPDPTFGEYERCFPDAATYVDACGYALDDVAAQAAHHDVVVLVNPNNPTGTTYPAAALRELCLACPTTFFLVDESFAAFAGQGSLADVELPANALLLVSLSKTLGVPGLRLGYARAQDPALGEDLRRALPIWNNNAIAEYFLETLFKYRPELEASFVQSRADKARLIAGLQELPDVEVFPGGANFVLVRIPAGRCPQGVAAALLAGWRIYVKDVTRRFDRVANGGDCWLRLAVRLPLENERLVAALGTLLHGREHGEPLA
ncbi:MAG: aminotransferase class I/II-fold pyridoxal phosphate-dependent enzyme [Myxococcota bacterium]|jgi:histidinol-phosphate/aromatic aminotransferase/cobyric acid decarboxylase-like protein/choline kinase|nr:aminotransferase class I/II-fold pyridoxal phosphate-dependent enzyme [Myxococcota bacterium]